MSVFSVDERACSVCGETVYRRRRALLGRRGPGRWVTVWLHIGGGEDCPPLGDRSPACPGCGRDDASTTGNVGEFVCVSGCELVFRVEAVS